MYGRVVGKPTNMKTHIKFLSATAIGLVTTCLTASAGLIGSTTYGGHWYGLYDGSVSWPTASANAGSVGGYLAVLTTAAENNAVYSGLIGTGFFKPEASQDTEAWLGGSTADNSGSTMDPNNWSWVTGEAWTAFNVGNFGGGEPNGDSLGLAINRYGTAQYNDEGGHTGGWIVEKNSVPDTGSSALLLGVGLVVVGAFGLKLRK